MIYQEKWQQAWTYEEYRAFVQDRLAEGKGTGDNHTELYLHFTKMNEQRMNRLEKTFKENAFLTELFAACKCTKVLVITEGWCGDAAQNIPILESYAKLVGLETKYVLRDQHEDLMNLHLTNGGKSIPVFIFLNENWEVERTWGPRPAPVQKMVMDYNASPEPKESYLEFAKKIQLWYAKDKQQTLESELMALLQMQEVE